MKYIIIISVLTVIIVVGGVFSVMGLVDLTDRVNDLQNKYVVLQTSYNNLQSGYNELDSNYRTTLQNYNLLDTNYNTLQSNFNSIQDELQSVRSDYISLEADYESLESEYKEVKAEVVALNFENRLLESKNSRLQSIVNEYESVPNSYYSTNMFRHHENTWGELQKFLTSEFKLPREYELNVFDCSESSAYLEWALENAGFWAEIVVGPDPSGEGGMDHAWVIAYTKDYKVAIEATALTTRDRYIWLSWDRTPGVIYGNDNLIDYWENYYEKYDKRLKNIYIAIRESGYSRMEWNWWEEYSIF